MPINLAAVIDWTRLLAVLSGYEPAGLLPRTARCPLCRAVALDVFQDTTNGGYWYRCRNCLVAGDSVELAEAVWQLPRWESCNRLHELGLMPPPARYEFERYETWYVAKRRLAQNLWNGAIPRLSKAIPLYQLRKALGADGIHADLWPHRGGRYAGAMARADVARLISPRKITYTMPSPVHQCTIEQWSEALVIPFYDLPNRMSAVYLACREAMHSDQLYTGVLSVLETTKRITRQASGAAMLDVLFQETTDPDLVFVVFDPLFAARLHIRHLTDNSINLPVVAVWPETYPLALLRSHAPAKKLVCWGNRPDPDIFRHAQQLNAHVVFDKPDGADILRRTGQVHVPTWIQREVQRSRHWSEALEQYLQSATVVDAESFLTRINMSLTDLRRFLLDSPPALRQRLSDVIAVKDLHRAVPIGPSALGGGKLRGQVVETVNGWHVDRTREVITDAPFRIETIYSYSQSKTSHYCGHIRFHGQEVPFIAYQHHFDSHPFRWIRRFLTKNGYSVSQYSERWRRYALGIATGFQEPQIVINADIYGWSTPKNAWIFPHYCIDRSGNTVAHDRPLPKLSQRRPVPALALPQPGQLSDTTVQRLDRSDILTDTLWSVVACIAHNLLATPSGYLTAGVCLLGSATVLRMATLAGCSHTKFRHREGQYVRSVAATAKAQHEIETQHGWPVTFSRNSRRQQTEHYGASDTTRTWIKLSPHNCFAAMSWLNSRAVASSGNWLQFDSDLHATVPIPRDIEEILPQLLPLFLAWWCREGRTADTAHRPLNATIELLDRWFTGLGGTLDRIRQTTQKAVTDYRYRDRADSFLTLVAQMYLDNKLRLIWADRQNTIRKGSRRPNLIYRLDRKAIWIPQEELYRLMTTSSIYTPDPAVISGLLAERDPRAGREEYDGRLGWNVPEEIWNEAVARMRQVPPSEPRKYGQNAITKRARLPR